MGVNIFQGFKDLSRRKRQAIIFSIILLFGLVLIGMTVYLFIEKGEFETYVNDQYKFSIKYPADWIYKENYMGTVVIFISPKEGELDTFQESVSVVFYDLSQSPMSLKSYTESTRRQLQGNFAKFGATVEEGPATLSGRAAYKYVWKERSKMSGSTQFMHVWTIDSSRLYQVSYVAVISNFDKFLGAAKSMIKSFNIIK